VVSPLDRKLLRDLFRLKGQLLTIALVVACGIAAFVSLKGNWVSLRLAKTAYYERYRFADVFAHLERGSEALVARLEAIEGVARVHTRVVEGVMLPLDGMPEPIKGQVISIEVGDKAPLCDIHLRDGRKPRAGRSDEAVLLQSFADAHSYTLGTVLPVVINGKQRSVRVVGLAMSPEYILAMSAGDISPDPGRFAVLWMDRAAVAAAYQMEGAFNDVVLRLQPGASKDAVLGAVDRVLKPYGGLGAIGRDKQLSNYTIESEMTQLQSMSSVVPVIFLAVAALLLNIVLSRMVSMQRPEIATLKAVGYSDWQVGVHFLKMVLAIGLSGAVVGVLLGAYLGNAMLGLYGQFFKFPNLVFRLDLRASLTAVAISFGAAAIGAFGAVRNVMKLPPAEAMRPAPPARYRRSIVDLLGIGKLLGPAVRMIIRELERRPLRAVASAFAIAASVGLTVVGGWYVDGMDLIIETQFHEVMREDLLVAFSQSRPERAVRDLSHLPGVLHAEGLRAVPVRFRSGHHFRDGTIWGYPADSELRTVRDKYGVVAKLPPDGVVLTEMLGTILGIGVGDRIEVEVRDGDRRTRNVTVTGLVDESFGLQGHMQLGALRNWLREERVVSMGLLRIDPSVASGIDERLKKMPYVASVTRRRDILDRFRDQSAGMIMTFATIITLFAATICVGVVYNNARVALSLRARDLASLRVLGFTRAEISAILLGEMAIQVLVALPLGLLIGNLMVHGLASTIDPETYRLPIVLSSRTYAFATVVVLGASALSALLVRRKLDKLDLIAVLKTRE